MNDLLVRLVFVWSILTAWVLPAHGADQTAVHSFKVSPSYFVSNVVSQKTGKRLVENDTVVAFLQTTRGRVLFTASGAYLGMAGSQAGAPNPKKADLLEDAFGDQEASTVVLKTGFCAERSKRKNFTHRLQHPATCKTSFFIGPRDAWQANVPTYRSLVYEQVWDGIDLEFLGFMDHLEYRLRLAAGADPKDIVMETGGQETKLTSEGALIASRGDAHLRLGTPRAFQIIDGQEHDVIVRYTVLDHGRFGFELGPFDTHRPLIIDPDLTWSSYLGGAGGTDGEELRGIAIDGTHNVYVTGHTGSTDFPTTVGSFDQTWNGTEDVVITKLNSAGSSLVYSLFLGGSGYERGLGIAVNSLDEAFVTGYTDSTDFPVTSGAYSETSSGSYDVFVTRINSSGTALVYSTYLGGSSWEEGHAIALDDDSNAYVTGFTYSSNFPTTPGAYDESGDGFKDVFVTKLNKTGTALAYSTFLADDRSEEGNGIAVDDSGNAYVVGNTDSSDFPTTLGAFDRSYNGHTDGFLTKFNADGSALSYSTFLGGSDSDECFGIAVDGSHNAYITGETESSDFPAPSGSFDPTFNGGLCDAFATKVNSSGSGLVYSTFLGGENSDQGAAIAVDGAGCAYVSGSTASSDFPTTPGAFDETFNVTTDAFVTKVSSNGKNLIYATYLGDVNGDRAYGIAVDDSGNAYVAGCTTSSGLPTTPGAFSRTKHGGADMFVTKVNNTGTSLTFSTFLGGSGEDSGFGIAVDRDGCAYVVGATGSNSFPTTPGSYSTTLGGSEDAFLVKMDWDGSDLVYATFFGGSENDTAFGVAVDYLGIAYVTGSTRSSDFPTTPDAYDETYNGNTDAFVLKVYGDGTDLYYATFLGGDSSEVGRAIALEGQSVYVTGHTFSENFPTLPPCFDDTYNGGTDVFVSHLNHWGTGLIYSTFLGGSGDEKGEAITVESPGRAIVAGTTGSSNFPTTPGAYDESYNGQRDVFVTQLDDWAIHLVYSTFLGGPDYDSGDAIAIDGSGNVYVTGSTESSAFPITPGACDPTFDGRYEAFVTKLVAGGSTLSYSTFLGGSDKDYGHGIAVDDANGAWVMGNTHSSDFPTTPGAFDETYNGIQDVFVSRVNADGSALSYATFLGGSNREFGYGLALDSAGNVYVMGVTNSAGFPTTAGAFDPTQNGYGDAFVSKFFALPVQPYRIYGENEVCANDSGVTYATRDVPGATSYTWTVPADASISGGQGTTEITVDFGTESGEISVTAQSPTGSSPPQTKAVTVFGEPPQPGVITGSETVCAYATGVTYSIEPMPQATTYTWTVTSGAGIASGQGTTEITVDFGAASSIISVTPENPCETGSTPQSTVVVVIDTPDQPGSISGPSEVCEYETSVPYSISPVAGATEYTWTVPPGAGISTGQGTTNITVDFGTASGNVSVTAENSCGISPARTASITVHTPVTITQDPGNTTVCPGGMAVFSVTASGTETLEYRWYRDGSPLFNGGHLSGCDTDTLVIDPVCVDDEGDYDCTVTNLCGPLTSDSATLTADGPLEVTFAPQIHCQGLNPISFVAQTSCARPEITYNFSTSPVTGFSTTGNIITIGVAPPPAETTQIDVTVTDDVSRETVMASAILLVSQNPLYFDLSADLCNNLRDWWLLAEDWRHSVTDDPNGDDFIDIRDFLYLNLDDPLSCGSD